MSESLVLDLPNGKTCHVTSVAMRTVAKYLRWETFRRGQYSHAGFELQVDDTVIDIGANIGMFALWVEPQIPRGRLICIEPNPYALECLRMNIRQNDLRNVTVVDGKLGVVALHLLAMLASVQISYLIGFLIAAQITARTAPTSSPMQKSIFAQILRNDKLR